MPVCTITGTLRNSQGIALASTKVVFERSGVAGQDGAVVIPRSVEVTSDEFGAISVDLYPGVYTGITTGIRGQYKFAVGVPEELTADLADIIDQFPAITPSLVTQAIAARDAAEGFAEAADLDAIATAEDRIQTGLDVLGAAASAVMADARADDAASFAGFRDFKNFAAFMAATLSYGTGAQQVQAGDVIRLREEGFAYNVAATGAGNQHLTHPGGVKLYVRPGPSGPVSIKAFGATGLATDNQNDALVAAQNSGLPIFFPVGVYTFTTPLTIYSLWEGQGEGEGDPGSSTDTAGILTTSELRFNGVGQAITSAHGIRGLCLRGNIEVAGQSGLLVLGGSCPSAQQIRILDFDGVAFSLGTGSSSSVYFGNIDGIQVNTKNRMGTLACLVQGGGTSSSNANMLNGLHLKGAFERLIEVRGNDNKFAALTLEVKKDWADLLSGTIIEAALITGQINTFENTYIEPIGGGSYPMINFSSTSKGNVFSRSYTPNWGGPAGRVIDLGTGNSLDIVPIGENFPQSQGRKYSERNLIPNPTFVSASPSSLPYGWVAGGGSTGAVAIDDAVKRGGNRSIRITTAETRFQLDCSIAATGAPATGMLSLLPLEAVRGQTITAGAWCFSNLAGFGALAVFQGANSVGGQSHTGDGTWQFLSIQTRVPDDAASLTIRLRNNSFFQNNTGECWFSEPVLVLGNDVSRFAGLRLLDSEDPIVLGRLTQNFPVPLTVNSATPSVANGNNFTEANASATTITNFLNGRDGQEIRIGTTTGNTTIANSSTIRTNTGAAKLLEANRIYRFIRFGGVWLEG